jgi:predicted transcriptional regulator
MASFAVLHAADIHLDSPLRWLERYEGAPVDRIRGATREGGAAGEGGESMKARIEIQSLEEGLKDFRATWKAAAAGKTVTPRQGTYFTSLEAARNVLTPNRLQLLRAIRQGRPASIYKLAQLVGRDFKNVHADVQALAAYGLISLKTTRVGRRTTVPRVPFSVIEFRIAV